MPPTSSFAIDVPDSLLARARGGERAAFEQLYRWFERPVFTLALRIGGDREEAADVLQDTMLKVLNRINEFRGTGGSPFWAWLRQIAVNEALMRLRSRRSHGTEVAIDDEYDLEDHAPPPPAAADTAQLQRALAALPAITRSVLWLYHAEGYTHEEIAALMQRTTSFSKSQLARGSRRLRQLLDAPNGSGSKPRRLHILPWRQHWRCVMPESFIKQPPETPKGWGEAFAALPLEVPAEESWARVARALDARTLRTRATRRERRDWMVALASAAVLAVVIWAPLGRQRPSSHGASSADTINIATPSSHTTVAATTPSARNSHQSGDPPSPSSVVLAGYSPAQTPQVDRERARQATDRLIASLRNSAPATAVAQASTDPLQQLQAQSAQLEALVNLARDDRVSSALGLALTSELDSRISLIDAALSQTDLPATQRVALWQQRVDALRELAGIESTQRWLAARGEHLDGTLVTVD